MLACVRGLELVHPQPPVQVLQSGGPMKKAAHALLLQARHLVWNLGTNHSLGVTHQTFSHPQVAHTNDCLAWKPLRAALSRLLPHVGVRSQLLTC